MTASNITLILLPLKFGHLVAELLVLEFLFLDLLGVMSGLFLHEFTVQTLHHARVSVACPASLSTPGAQIRG